MTNLQHAFSIDDLRTLARRRLPRTVFEYVDGGAEDEACLRRNRAVFERVAFKPHMGRDVGLRSQQIELFGESAASPFLIGPTGFAGLMWPEADQELARAARAAGVPFVLSTPSTVPLERVAREAGGRLWFQLYLARRRAISEAVVQRAMDAGFQALVVTLDVPVPGKRERDLRNGFTLPLRVTPGNLLDILTHPRWLASLLATGMPRFRNFGTEADGANDARSLAALMASQIDPSVGWEDIRWLRRVWPRTLLVKGILRGDDALQALDCGADGLVVSNHGGRQLDGSIAALEALPEVVAAVGPATPVLIDSGFRRGGDIVKALALGARAVLLGRATLYGVAAGGQPGAARALDILRAEVDSVLALLGCRSIDEVGPDLLVHPELLAAGRVPARPSVEFTHTLVKVQP